MMHLASLLFAFCGFAGLCAAMNKHQPELVGHRLGQDTVRVLRGFAGVALAASYACAVAVGGWRFGSVEWTGAIMIAALALTLLLPYRPSWIVPMACGGSLAGGLTCALLVVLR